MDENNGYENVEVTEEEYALADQMAGCLLKIWKLVGFFVGGWLLLMLGVAFMYHAVDAFFLGLLCAGAGLVLMPLPSVKLIWRGAGLRAMFNTEYFIETTYSDGRKTTSYDFGGTMVSKLITLAIAFALGFIMTPIRVLMGIMAFNKAKKKLGIGKLPLKEDVLLPLIVTPCAFILGIVLCVSITSIAEAKYEKELRKSDYSASERAQMLTDLEEALLQQSFGYEINGCYMEEGNRCLVVVDYEAGRYEFTVKAGYIIAYVEETNNIERVDLTQEDSSVPFGCYIYENGEWTDSADGLNAEQKALLESCMIEAYFAEFKKHDLVVKDKSVAGEEGYSFSMCYDKDEETHWEIYKGSEEGAWSFGGPYRLLLGIIDGIYGAGSEIMFK